MRKLFVVAVLGVLLLAGCGDDDSDTETSGGVTATTTGDGHDHAHPGMDTGGDTATCEPSGTTLSIVASNTKFDKDCLAAPAGQAFTIAFENKDTTAHSLVFLKTHTSNENLFPGADVFTGPKTTTVNAPPQTAGTYAFHCTIHPSVMEGTFIVK